ncbi:MAG: DUF885 domain-containing protein, partial [Cellvibrionaceae bacterium]|nr:DUF885 domain-containing protein [Cellvibrionaceae bacterium]
MLTALKTHVYCTLALCWILLLTSACSTQSNSTDSALPEPEKHDAGADSALQTLIDQHWQDTLQRDPVFATTLGVRDYDQKLGSLSVAAMDAEAESAKNFLRRLQQINRQALSENARLNRDLLARHLRSTIARHQHSGRLMLFTNRGGWHLSFARLPERLNFKTAQDYKNYLARLRDFPRYNDEGIATLRAGIAAGYTQPCKSMAGFAKSISSHSAATAADSVFMRPFTQPPATPTSPTSPTSPTNSADGAMIGAMRKDAEQVLEQAVLPAYRKLLAFYTDEYNAACRNASGLYGLPGAVEYYQYLASYYTTTQLSPKQIHSIGLDEVARINREMQQVMEQVKFKGDRQAFNHFLRTDPQFYPKTPAEHLKNTAYIAKQADGGLPA